MPDNHLCCSSQGQLLSAPLCIEGIKVEPSVFSDEHKRVQCRCTWDKQAAPRKTNLASTVAGGRLFVRWPWRAEGVEVAVMGGE